MAIILKANKVNLFVSSVLFVFWYHLPNILDTPRIITHIIGVTSEVGYISATTRRGDHEVYMVMWWHWGKNIADNKFDVATSSKWRI
jgi:hypothetical protein